MSGRDCSRLWCGIAWYDVRVYQFFSSDYCSRAVFSHSHWIVYGKRAENKMEDSIRVESFGFSIFKYQMISRETPRRGSTATLALIANATRNWYALSVGSVCCIITFCVYPTPEERQQGCDLRYLICTFFSAHTSVECQNFQREKKIQLREFSQSYTLYYTLSVSLISMNMNRDHMSQGYLMYNSTITHRETLPTVQSNTHCQFCVWLRYVLFAIQSTAFDWHSIKKATLVHFIFQFKRVTLLQTINYWMRWNNLKRFTSPYPCVCAVQVWERADRRQIQIVGNGMWFYFANKFDRSN